MRYFITAIILILTIQLSLAATGSRSGEDCLIYFPLAILVIYGSIYYIREYVKKIKMKKSTHQDSDVQELL